ncbi:VOC family protein [Mesorhizobium neociceri]|uniref:VOC family protein n=1 Tax=Mesorhizobium neociceri TaxID=1307853 RepID=A0A838BA46_9HYPH|nr:VOC family protein [Mesorhizobium neociceri]MBA1142937.1 VOC family protein [Mesorhizobium neociceri]
MPAISRGNGFSVSIDCESLDEIERLFSRLAEGSRLRAPLATMPWGTRFGLLTDRYGVQWILNFVG